MSEPTLKHVVKKVIPARARHMFRHQGLAGANWRENLELAGVYSRSLEQKAGDWIQFRSFNIRINDGPNFYMLCKDIFVKRLYHFEAVRPNPRIIDCGGNIGMSVMYFKHLYPKANITAFEPDPAIFPYFEDNMRENRMQDVTLVQAAVNGKPGVISFFSDGRYGSCISDHAPAGLQEGWTRYEVPCVRLSDYLDQPVDFLKMNIEGAERDVISECADRLRQVRELIIEYHHLPGLPRTLHEILTVLHNQGFEYLINDFDSETNAGINPPFSLTPDSRYLLLIYARRLD